MNKPFSFVVLFFIGLNLANGQAAEPSEEKLPAISLDLGLDYLKLVSLALPHEDKYEGLAALNFGFGLSIDGEFGFTKKSPEHIYKNGNYSFEGSYYRIGIGYNYPIKETNIVGLGIRYAKSDFKDYSEFTYNSRYFSQPYPYTIENPWKNHSAQWAEIVIKTEGPIKKVKNLKLGMFIRLKYLDPIQQNEDFPIQAIPGYGLTKSNTTAAVNFYLKYSIPLMK